MTKALLIIDYTNDFIADDGALTCGKPGQAIEGHILELADEFYQNGDYVIFPTDGHTHDKFSPEYKLFPPPQYYWHFWTRIVWAKSKLGMMFTKIATKFISSTRIVILLSKHQSR